MDVLNNIKPIGGYFELELGSESCNLHRGGLLVNSCRNALEYVILSNEIKKIYIPKFTCVVILDPIVKHNVEYEFYNINSKLEIADNINLGLTDCVLYTNYFGIKDEYVSYLAEKYQNKLIVDNAQALFAGHIENTNSIYSPRKYVGMPDGGIVYSCNTLLRNFNQDVSYMRCTHLLKRHDLKPSEGYADFCTDECSIANKDIMWMSNLSKRIFESIDVERIVSARRRNFEYLHRCLSQMNLFSIPKLDSFTCPMVYPFYSSSELLRKKLISKDIFVATYWPNVFDWCQKESIEYEYASHLLPLPIDQRYGIDDMNRIIDVILNG